MSKSPRVLQDFTVKVRKTLSYSKELRCLAASCAWEDAVYDWIRPNRSLRVASSEPGRKWDHRTPAMAAGLI